VTQVLMRDLFAAANLLVFFVRYTLLQEKETVLRFLKQPIFKIVLQKSFSIIV